MTVYGYARCSTDNIKQDIDRQKEELKAKGIKIENMYFEYITSRSKDRIQLQRLLDIVKEGDTIMALELTRITRSVRELCEIIDLAQEKKIILMLGNFTFDCSKPLDAMQIGMLQMMSVFAELERNITSERVKSGLENARRKGKKIGRRKVKYENLPLTVRKMYKLYEEGQLNKKTYASACNITRPTLDKYIKIIEEYNNKD